MCVGRISVDRDALNSNNMKESDLGKINDRD